MRLPKFKVVKTKTGSNRYMVIWYKYGAFFQKSTDGTWTWRNKSVKLLDFRKFTDEKSSDWTLFVGPIAFQIAKVH